MPERRPAMASADTTAAALLTSQCRRLKCRDGSVQAMQLDIFDHSCDVMLRNDVGAALARRDAFAARSAWHLFKDECPTDETVPALAV